MLNFRIGFLSSIGVRLPYPCLPTPFPILILRLRAMFSRFYRGQIFGESLGGSQAPREFFGDFPGSSLTVELNLEEDKRAKN